VKGTTGSFRCWRSNEPDPPIVGQGLARAIAAYRQYACVVRVDGRVYCFGVAPGEAQLVTHRGRLTTCRDVAHDPAYVPVTNAVGIAAGPHHVCVVLRDGTVRCWGGNREGELGSKEPRDITCLEKRNVETSTPKGLRDIVQVAVGDDHSCALDKRGSVWCWGKNDVGQLGDGDTASRAVPARVRDLSEIVQIAAGENTSCGVFRSGEIACWGDNRYGQIGDGTREPRLLPQRVKQITDAMAVGTAAGLTCALRTGGTVACWGDNTHGQLGIGTPLVSPVPVNVPIQGPSE
jgi:alpha-tubulin suppressor-like RCC1 family protein